MGFAQLLVLFIFMPLLELVLLLRVGGWLGWHRALLLVLVTGFVGAALARAQGLALLGRIRRDMTEGRMPAPRILDGVMILVAGALLITPGLITDAVGFLLLVPPVRREIRVWLRRKLEAKLRDGTANVHVTYYRSGPDDSGPDELP